MRKAPKSFLKISPGRKAAITPPRTENATAGITRNHTPSPLISPCFLWTLKLKAAIGRKAKRLVACATCCSTPVKIVRAGIKIAPPPIPMPPNSPEKKPITR